MLRWVLLPICMCILVNSRTANKRVNLNLVDVAENDATRMAEEKRQKNSEQRKTIA